MEATRLDTVERRTEDLEERLTRLEQLLIGPQPARRARPALVSPPPPAPPTPQPAMPPPPPRPAARDRPLRAPQLPAQPRPSLEDLLGGRVLAWIGGVAMLVGLVLFFALAVSSGWIGETGRVLLVAAGSLGLLGLGVWLHDARGRTDAALASVATGIAGLFISVTVASRVYELVPAEAGFVLALGVGAVATWVAVAWEARVVGALGIVGALLAPAFVGAPSDQGTMALLFAASASAVAVLVWQRWDWLGFAVVLVTAPQWIVWVGTDPGVPEALVGMTLFGLVGAAAAAGYELRVRADGLRPSSSFLLSLNAVLLATAGSIAFTVQDHEVAVKGWLAALALAHLCLGLIGLRSERVARELSLLALVIAVMLGDLAYATTFSGTLLAAGFAAAVVLFGILGRRGGLPRVDLQLVSLGLGGHVALSIGSTLLSGAPPELLVEGGTAGAGALTAIASVAASCLVSSRLAEIHGRDWRRTLDTIGLVAVAYLTTVAFDGTAVVLALVLEAVVLTRLGRDGDEVAKFAGPTFLAGAAAHTLAIEAPLESLVEGVPDLVQAAVALGACVLGALGLALAGPDDRRLRTGSWAAAGLALLFLASVAVVDAHQPSAQEVVSGVLDVSARQQGQMLLSALWAAVGVGLLVAGLQGSRHELRAAALALLLVTVGKVFLYDLSELSSGYRVVSFLALGTLLLAAAFVWQRMRPKPAPDMRSVPPALR